MICGSPEAHLNPSEYLIVRSQFTGLKNARGLALLGMATAKHNLCMWLKPHWFSSIPKNFGLTDEAIGQLEAIRKKHGSSHKDLAFEVTHSPASLRREVVQHESRLKFDQGIENPKQRWFGVLWQRRITKHCPRGKLERETLAKEITAIAVGFNSTNDLINYVLEEDRKSRPTPPNDLVVQEINNVLLSVFFPPEKIAAFQSVIGKAAENLSAIVEKKRLTLAYACLWNSLVAQHTYGLLDESTRQKANEEHAMLLFGLGLARNEEEYVNLHRIVSWCIMVSALENLGIKPCLEKFPQAAQWLPMARPDKIIPICLAPPQDIVSLVVDDLRRDFGISPRQN